MKRMTLAISAAVLMLAGAGFAAEEHGLGLRSETRAEAQAHAGHLFDKLDLNHDGKLDQADRAAWMSGMFDRIDTNHDGVISRAEFAELHEHVMDQGHDAMAHPGMNDEHPGKMGHWGEDHHEMHGLVMLILQRADPGHTGAVTRDGFVKAALSLFDQADGNHDGVLTPAEHRDFAQAMRQQMRADWSKHGGPDDDMSPPAPPPPAK